jgi:methylenetetrahydrofolate reductase (NADPH)
MNRISQRSQDGVARCSVEQSIVCLARDASVEMNVQDVPHLAASRTMLAPGKKLYVSHLPKQAWSESVRACVAVRSAGFDPVPHIPVRLIATSRFFDELLKELVRSAQVEEVLLIAGDYPQALGPYASVIDVLHDGLLNRNGIGRVSFAGHPEGHPRVSLETIRNAERQKVVSAAGLDVTLLTQFFFEHQPFLQWAKELQAFGVRARIVGGLSGPATVATLFKFAMRCGVGASIRALGARPTSLIKLVGDHGPEHVVRGLADARNLPNPNFSGIHLFCFGGYIRTCRWLQAVANGHFDLNDEAFEVYLPKD